MNVGDGFCKAYPPQHPRTMPGPLPSFPDFRNPDSLPPSPSPITPLLHGYHINFLNLCIDHVSLLQKNSLIVWKTKTQIQTPTCWKSHDYFSIRSHLPFPSNIHPFSVSHSLPKLVIMLFAHLFICFPREDPVSFIAHPSSPFMLLISLHRHSVRGQNDVGQGYSTSTTNLEFCHGFARHHWLAPLLLWVTVSSSVKWS